MKILRAVGAIAALALALVACPNAASASTISVEIHSYYSPSLAGQQVDLYAYGTSPCTITSYAWDFGDGSASSSTNDYVSHTWYNVGSYLVRLTMTDSCGSSISTSVTQSVVTDQPPVISVSFTISGSTVFADPSATTDTDGSVPEPTGPYYYYWSWGDGAYTESYASSSGGLASHTYATAGSHTVKVTAYDSAYNSSSKTYTVSSATAPSVVQETSSTIAYSGAWSNVSCPGCSGGFKKVSGTIGNNAVLHFTGTKAAWIASTGPQSGKAKVYVDGVLKTTINLYSATAADQVKVYTTPALTRGTHSLKLVLTLAKKVSVDAFDVWS